MLLPVTACLLRCTAAVVCILVLNTQVLAPSSTPALGLDELMLSLIRMCV